jgi:glucose-6-phosphate 1-epimerase
MHATLPPGIRLESGPGGLDRLVIATPACTAELVLQGAHLCRWHPAGHPHPVLWMSQASRFEPGAPIRGGVPVCFPWFGPRAGDPAAPPHGFARVKPWTLDGVNVEADGTAILRLSLRADDTTRTIVPQDFTATFTVRVGATLGMALRVENRGPGAFRFEEALHTYFTVGDVRQVRVEGLQGATYLDKTDGGQRKTQTDAEVTVSAETDRLYLDTVTNVTVTDPVLARRLTIAKAGSLSTVVWNPWVAKSWAMPDFGDEEWPGMICIETVNAVDNAVTLAEGASHELSATVTVETIR